MDREGNNVPSRLTPLEYIRQFLRLESASGLILFLVTILAMILANSPLAFIHNQFIAISLFWINEVLMAVFFLVVGLELKRGFLDGELSPFSQVALPAVAAFGGMLIPALIYYGINYSNPTALKGWAIPVATDIAFALGVLSLFGSRVPRALKLFLLLLAIFDDIGAICIIAVFYTQTLLYVYLLKSVFILSILILFNILSVDSLIAYGLLGSWLWLGFWYAGIHPTIAGFLLGLVIPDRGQSRHNVSPLRHLENRLHPWVAYLIMPLFALVNAGFSLHGLSLHTLTMGVVFGITVSLFIGKQLGIFCFTFLLIHLRLATLPEKSSWLMLYGVAIVCGIGFTMSLFLGTLSFESETIYQSEVRLGVMMGSLLSGLLGGVLLLIAFAKKRSDLIE